MNDLPVLKDDAEVITADYLAEDQHSTNHRKPAHTRDGQGHPCALPAFWEMFPIADQQEGRERRQLPEDQQKQNVIAQDNANHRALEKQQVGEELAHIVITA